MSFAPGHALLIGVSSYTDAHLHGIDAVAADAEDLADVLKDPNYCGYPSNQVVSMTGLQASRARILSEMSRLASDTTQEDTVTIFYCGHGTYDSSGEYNLTTCDTRIESKKAVQGTAISQKELLEHIKAIKAQRLLVIVNACHAGEISPTLGDDQLTIGQSLPQTTADALLATGRGRIVITSCNEDQVSYVGRGKHTIFSQALIDGFKGKGTSNTRGYVSVFDLYTHLYDTVTATVERRVPAAVRARYSTTSEPELSILKGVGPFPIALFRGATMLGDFPTNADVPDRDAVRLVEPKVSQEKMQHITSNITISRSTVGVFNAGPVGTQTNTINSRDRTSS